MLIHQFAALLGEELEAARLHRIRFQTAEPIRMLKQEVQDEIAIYRIALGSGRVDALAVMVQIVGVHDEQVQMGIFGQNRNQRSARLF